MNARRPDALPSRKMQLDLFADSRGAILRNRLVDALRSRDTRAGRKAFAALATEYSQDALLGPAEVLLEQVGRRIKPFSDPSAAQRAVDRMDSAVVPAAMKVFGPAKAHEWLTPLWLALADAVAALAFCAEAPDAHAAGLLVRARRWEAARTAVQTIDSWRGTPRPLAWMARITFELEGLEAAWPVLAELAWLDPPGFAAVARGLAAPSLARLLREFDRDFVAGDDAEFAWFPAWALLAEPGLAAAPGAAQTPVRSPPEQAAHIVMQLASLERQGRHYEVVAKRKALRALHEALFARYMATRS